MPVGDVEAIAVGAPVISASPEIWAGAGAPIVAGASADADADAVRVGGAAFAGSIEKSVADGGGISPRCRHMIAASDTV
ncbi:MAG: hypothetical protein ACLQJL_16485 [Roseiarcus sp.]